MYRIDLLNKISEKGLGLFTEKYEYRTDIPDADGILVRSKEMKEMVLPSSLKAIARAGAGVNNIPIDKCSEKGIVVFNTPGANANGVKELVIAGLLLSSRRIVPGVLWAKTLAGQGEAVPSLIEKGKSQYTGPEIKGKSLGVVGLGAIGVMVATNLINRNICPRKPGHLPVKEVTDGCVFPIAVVHIAGNDNKAHLPFNRLICQSFKRFAAGRCDATRKFFIG